MNRRGQTLVEFVIILPVFLLILFYVIDFGRIIYSKNKLENTLNDVVFMLKNSETASELNKLTGSNVTLNIKDDTNYRTVSLSEKIYLTAPGFNFVLPNPYEVVVSRVIYNETE